MKSQELRLWEIGACSQLSAVLERAVDGLFVVATHLSRLPSDKARDAAQLEPCPAPLLRDAQGGNAPIAEEALVRIAALFGIERTICGHVPEYPHPPDQPTSRRQIDQLTPWAYHQVPEHGAYASVSLKRRESMPINYTARRQRSHGAGKQDRRQPDAETQLTDLPICSLD